MGHTQTQTQIGLSTTFSLVETTIGLCNTAYACWRYEVGDGYSWRVISQGVPPRNKGCLLVALGGGYQVDNK